MTQKVYVNSGYYLIDGKKLRACCLLEDLPLELAKSVTRVYRTKESGIYYTNYEDSDLSFSSIEKDKELTKRRLK